MKRKISFKNAKGNKLVGVLSNPTNDMSRPIIILCHGFSTGKSSDTYVSLEQRLNKKIVSTFRFDFFGHGESEGKFEDITTTEAVDDILNAIKFLKKLGYRKIGLVGTSFGGIASIMAASKTDDLQVLALKSPVSNYEDKYIKAETKEELEEWKRKGWKYYITGDGKKLRLNYNFYEDFKNNDGYKAVKKIKIPTIIIHGDKDESVPVEQSKKTASLMKNCKLEIIKEADHRYSKPEDREKMLNLISEFVVKNSL